MKSVLLLNNYKLILYNQYHSCWCIEDVTVQDRSSHGIGTILPEFSLPVSTPEVLTPVWAFESKSSENSNVV